MAIEGWLPVGFDLPGGAKVRSVTHAGDGWQILGVAGGAKALVVESELMERWMSLELLEPGALFDFGFGAKRFFGLVSGLDQMLCPVAEGISPNSKAEALAFAIALRETRRRNTSAHLQDAIYVEKLSRLLPTFSISTAVSDDMVVGYWLSGGARVSSKSIRRLNQLTSWLGEENLLQVIKAAGLDIEIDPEGTIGVHTNAATADKLGSGNPGGEQVAQKVRDFSLPGRVALEEFFREHVIDIVQHKERYKSLGIGFPSAIILQGPPGCGKTFAVERLVEFFGWPSFQIDASSIASPYIHETSKKIAQVFDAAIKAAPSVLVIDEMDAFLSSREAGTGQHRVEEVAEFLRRIPEASKNEVLVIAMTNRLDMIDSAVLRRGRFDHIVSVEFASEAEVFSLLDSLLSKLPTDETVASAILAKELSGRPLSDVTFVVREGARLAGRKGRSVITQEDLLGALNSASARGPEGEAPRRIGFI